VISTYANLTSLQTLPQASVTDTATTVSQPGPDGADRATTVTITNTSASAAAFLLRPTCGGHGSGQELPGDQRAAVLSLAKQRRHAVPGRVAEADRHLEFG